jgi:DNA (cytosine-5)-methyltransferase 1
MKKPVAVDLFAGCGGLTLGLRQAGFRVIGAVEIDPGAAEAYRANHPRTRLRPVDIRKLSASAWRRELGLRKGELDLLAGCPPCQGFSVLRTRNGRKQNRDKRNDLVREMLRFARAFKPKAIMMENVPGLGQREAFLNLCNGLAELGYRVHWDIKNAAEYGVPQRRKRLILVAGLGFEIPFASASDSLVNVRDAIGFLPRPGKSGDELHDLPGKKRSIKIRQLIRDIPKNGGGRNDLPQSRQLPCHIRLKGFNDVYGRMAWGSPAPTITSGCFNPSKGRFLHPRQNRAITMREAALLQSFPRDYRFPVKRGKQAIALMIGNALPPEFIRRHALEIHRSLMHRIDGGGRPNSTGQR